MRVVLGLAFLEYKYRELNLLAVGESLAYVPSPCCKRESPKRC